LIITTIRCVSPAMPTITTSTGHHNSILCMTDIEYDRHPCIPTLFLRVNCAQSSIRKPSINGAIFPINQHYREASRSWKTNYEWIECNHHSMNVQWTCWSYSWMGPIREPNAKSGDELQVSTATTAFLLVERIPLTLIGVDTDCSRNLRGATCTGAWGLIIRMDNLLEQSMDTEIAKSIR
jgi:hypothetical protein